MIVSANYATFNNPARLKALKQSIESIIDQVDIVRVRFNHENGAEMLEAYLGAQLTARIEIFSGPDLTDLSKFHGLQFYQNEYFFTCDDDIIFPRNYVEFTKKMIEKHRCIVTYNGRVLVKENAYYGGKHFMFDYRREQTSDIRVDVPGTGVMAFRTDYFCPVEVLESPYRKMADLVFALEAKMNKKQIICLRRSAGWLKGIHLQGIWHEFNQGRNRKPEINQVKLMKQIINYEKTKN